MSNKKPFEYIENRIRLAAENTQPAVDEQAWLKMEALLDKEKRRRPFAWWWLMFPLLLAGAWGGYKLWQPSTISERGNSNISVSVDEAKKPFNTGQQKAVSGLRNTGAAVPVQKVPRRENETSTVADLVVSQDKIGPVNPQKIISGEDKKNLSKPVDKRAAVNKRLGVLNNDRNENIFTAGNIRAARKNVTAETAITVEEEREAVSAEPKIVEETPQTKKVVLVDHQQEKPAAAPSVQNSQQDSLENTGLQQNENKKDSSNAGEKIPVAKPRNKNTKGLYLLASGGVDAGSVQLFSYTNSTITPKYGVGIGYQLNDKLSVQTGLYITDKKYIAGPDDYHPKEDSYWNMVEITSVEASCLVYEIPLSVRYTFISTPTTDYYGMIGSSAYIMKKEDYKYCYNRYNIPYEKSWVYTGNKSFFSVLTFSAGVEKKISSKFSLLAEPSFSIPLSGVGDGRVKLFSSALQIAVKYRLFQRH